MKNILDKYPKIRPELPLEYQKIYNEHYQNNRNGKTPASFLSSHLESWLHRRVAKTSAPNKKTLEIGAGTLNQLKFEPNVDIYDIIEPFTLFYETSLELKKIRNIYMDISEVPNNARYDRITSIACFEHICNLPEVVSKCCSLLNNNGILAVSIPNQGRFLWKFSYTITTGFEFKKKYGLDYNILMLNEHVNTADEIEEVLQLYFKRVKRKMLGLGKNLSFYRYYECSVPKDNLL